MVTLTKVSRLTKKTNTVVLRISQEDYDRGMQEWNAGAMIQYAFPTLSSTEREFVLSGITPDEWDHFLGDDE